MRRENADKAECRSSPRSQWIGRGALRCGEHPAWGCDGFHQSGRCWFGMGFALHPVKRFLTGALSVERDQTAFKK